MQKTLADGLILRSLSEGNTNDKTDLPQFFLDVFTEAYGPDDEDIGPWTSDLLNDNHPAVTDEDVWVVVDPAHNERIVSALLLIPQVWCYDGIELPVGRVELVATHKDYRNRGLQRALFNALHERSESLGHNIQSITGIPYFYRQFGYAMAVDLGACGVVSVGSIPKLKDGEKPQYTLRRATVNDIPDMMRWFKRLADQAMLSVVRPREHWEYEMTTRQTWPRIFHIIEDQNNKGVGYVQSPSEIWGTRYGCGEYAVGEETSYLATYPDVLRGLHQYAKDTFKDKEVHLISFDSGLYEPLRPLLENTSYSGIKQTTYTWYIRVVDMVRLIQDIKPVLERRLVNSRAHGYTGTLHIDFYSKKGLFIRLEQGKIVEINNSKPAIDKEDAAFPYHSFLSVLFGHRTVAELNAVLPDAYVSRGSFKAAVLLETLFPRRFSWLPAFA